MSNLYQVAEQLQGEFSRLQSQWHTTASMWDDNARRRFEREFMEGYEPVIHSVLSVYPKIILSKI
jgi:hypothetical protein